MHIYKPAMILHWNVPELYNSSTIHSKNWKLRKTEIKVQITFQLFEIKKQKKIFLSIEKRKLLILWKY